MNLSDKNALGPTFLVSVPTTAAAVYGMYRVINVQASRDIKAGKALSEARRIQASIPSMGAAEIVRLNKVAKTGRLVSNLLLIPSVTLGGVALLGLMTAVASGGMWLENRKS